MQRKLKEVNRVYLMLLWCVFIASSFLIVTISLYDYRDTISGNLELDFYKSIFKTSLVISVFYMLFIWWIGFLRKKLLRNTLSFLLISVLWFFQVFIEFEHRVAGWSTFSLYESITTSISYSFSGILIALIFYIMILKLIEVYVVRKKVKSDRYK